MSNISFSAWSFCPETGPGRLWMQAWRRQSGESDAVEASHHQPDSNCPSLRVCWCRARCRLKHLEIANKAVCSFGDIHSLLSCCMIKFRKNVPLGTSIVQMWTVPSVMILLMLHSSRANAFYHAHWKKRRVWILNCGPTSHGAHTRPWGQWKTESSVGRTDRSGAILAEYQCISGPYHIQIKPDATPVIHARGRHLYHSLIGCKRNSGVRKRWKSLQKRTNQQSGWIPLCVIQLWTCLGPKELGDAIQRDTCHRQNHEQAGWGYTLQHTRHQLRILENTAHRGLVISNHLQHAIWKVQLLVFTG